MPMRRPFFNSRPMPRQMPPGRGPMQRRPMPPQKSRTDKELEETLKKLKDMGK